MLLQQRALPHAFMWRFNFLRFWFRFVSYHYSTPRWQHNASPDVLRNPCGCILQKRLVGYGSKINKIPIGICVTADRKSPLSYRSSFSSISPPSIRLFFIRSCKKLSNISRVENKIYWYPKKPVPCLQIGSDNYKIMGRATVGLVKSKILVF